MRLFQLKHWLWIVKNEALRVIGDSLHACELLREKIKTTIQEDAPG